MADEPWKANLRAQLQADDPTTPSNAMSALAKLWADWRMSQVPNWLKGPPMRFDSEGRTTPLIPKITEDDLNDMPFGTGGLSGVVKRTEVINALKEFMRSTSQSGRSVLPDLRLIDSLKNNPGWWQSHLNKIGGETQHALEPIGSGAYSYAFDVVPKSMPSGPPEVLKLYGEVSSPYLDRVLQRPPKGALAATRHGMADENVGFYVQPRASEVLDKYATPDSFESRLDMGRTMTPYGRYSDIVKKLNEQAAESGMTFWDDWMPNVGIYRGKPVGIDLGAYGGMERRRVSPMTTNPNDWFNVDWFGGRR